MIPLLQYLPFAFLSIVLLALIIKQRGFYSFEGLGSVFLMIAFVSDFIALSVAVLFSANSVGAATDLESRIYPTLIQTIGLLSLWGGLFVVSQKPFLLVRELTETERKQIIIAASFIVVLGLALKLTALYSAGFSSIFKYLLGLGKYRIAQGGYGGFLDNGTAIATFGMALLCATQEKSIFRQVVILIGAMLISFALSFSKSDLIVVLFQFFIVLGVLNNKKLKYFLSKRWLIALILPGMVLLLVFNTAVKGQFRSDASQINWSFDYAISLTSNIYQDRFGREGLYDGYSNFVNRLKDEEASFFNGGVVRYTTTAWIPYVIYSNKPTHPFRDTGYLFYKDYHSTFDEVCASMLVGSAYADYGVASVIIYLFFYGVLLGTIRIIAVNSKKNILLLIFYMHFMLIDGSTNMIHGGIINIFDTIALSTGVTFLTFIYMKILELYIYVKNKDGCVASQNGL